MTTQPPAQDVSDAALIEFSRIKLWFFRDLVDAQRKALFLLCGFSDAVTHGELDTHSAQLRALRHALRIDAAHELQQAQPVSSEELNALPDKIRRYIHDLETEADPAGTVRQNILVREENEMLRKHIELQQAQVVGEVVEVIGGVTITARSQRDMDLLKDALATPQSSAPVVDDAYAPVFAELERAVQKFPTWPTDPLHAAGVLNEEVGEMNKAILQAVYEPHKSGPKQVREEAIQAAAMALRFFLSLDRYEYTKGDQHQQSESALTGRGE